MNRVFIESEWSTLADMERDTGQLMWDEKHVQVHQKLGAEIIEGSVETFVWQELDLSRDL